MLGHLKEATIWTWGGVTSFFYFFRWGVMAVVVWLRGFAAIDTWVFKFFLLKVFLIMIGILVTSLPLWVLVLLSFAPPGIVGGIYFLAFLYAFMHFG